MYEFLYKSAVCASKCERMKRLETERERVELPAKRKRVSAPNHAFVLNASRGCIMCKNSKHSLYLCAKFKQLPVLKRIEAIKGAKLCYNCLRSHRGNACKFSNCTICQKRHNTLLHVDNYTKGIESDTKKTETAQTE